jgi:MFS family permease
LGIGAASLLADAGHEIPTSLLPSLLTSTLGAPAAALGIVEGLADGVAGVSRLAGGALADDPGRRRTTAVGGYVSTALLGSLIGAATSAWQVGALRVGSWAARGLRVPPRNALLADAVDPSRYGRAYGFERAMDNLGAIVGPLLAIALVAAVGVRTAIGLSIVPGLLAAAAIAYAVRHLPAQRRTQRTPIRIRLRPAFRGSLGRVMVGIGAFELGNVAATLLILRATELLSTQRDPKAATQLALVLYLAYNLAASAASPLAGRASDRRGAVRVLVGGAGTFCLAYLGFALTGPSVPLLGACFVAAGVGIGLVETAEHAAVAERSAAKERGSAFGALAAVQSFGNLAASGVAGMLWTLVSPAAAFGYAAAWMVLAVAAMLTAERRRRDRAIASA